MHPLRPPGGTFLTRLPRMVTQGHLMESNAEAQGELPKIYIMKTNFYSRMCVKHVGGVPMDTWDYPGVRRWTKKVDVFAMDYVRPLPAPRLPTTPREREREREREGERGRGREGESCVCAAAWKQTAKGRQRRALPAPSRSVCCRLTDACSSAISCVGHHTVAPTNALGAGRRQLQAQAHSVLRFARRVAQQVARCKPHRPSLPSPSTPLLRRNPPDVGKK
jgi:hypothetical protein